MLKEKVSEYYNSMINEYLKANRLYLVNWNAFDTSSMYKQQDILVNIYIILKGINLYIDKYEYIKDNISESILIEGINEAIKLLKLFKSFYEDI